MRLLVLLSILHIANAYNTTHDEMFVQIEKSDVTRLNCDDGLTSPLRLTHNRLLFTVPLDLPGQRATKYIHFCSDDTIEQVGQSFHEKYKFYLNGSEIFNNVIGLLFKRKLQYDQDRLELMKWTVWDKEKLVTTSSTQTQNIAKKISNKKSNVSSYIPHILHFIWLGNAPIPEYAKE